MEPVTRIRAQRPRAPPHSSRGRCALAGGFNPRELDLNCRGSWEFKMEQILINLVAGAVGGIGAGKSSTTFDLGTIGNIVAGAVGGGVLGQIVQLLLPSIMAAAQS